MRRYLYNTKSPVQHNATDIFTCSLTAAIVSPNMKFSIKQWEWDRSDIWTQSAKLSLKKLHQLSLTTGKSKVLVSLATFCWSACATCQQQCTSCSTLVCDLTTDCGLNEMTRMKSSSSDAALSSSLCHRDAFI